MVAPLTIHGDAYFENKELGLTKQKHRPGHLSEKLREALGMPEGAPPPWLIAQQVGGARGGCGGGCGGEAGVLTPSLSSLPFYNVCLN